MPRQSLLLLLIKQSYLPDAIILDLELHHGSGNGFQVLQGLKDLHLDHKPYILVTTNNTSAVMYETARQLGADFIMSKHQDDYSAQSVIDFLTMMKPVIQTHPQVGGHYTPVSPERLHQLRLQRIRTELRLVGISPKAIGYLYLIDAIDLVMQHLNTTQNLLMRMFSAILGKNGSRRACPLAAVVLV